MASQAERAAMRAAIDLATDPSYPFGPNPRVGCVLLDRHGVLIASGAHRGVGTAHAEADALTHAGEAARGATAVVTLEPCNHTGRTGPCAQALIKAGVSRVVFAQSDPNPVAAGGASSLQAAGIEVESGVLQEEAEAINHPWSVAVARARPFVTLKLASTLDGKIAALDGTSRWITSAEAREQVHELRGQVDAVLVGTSTALADDPELNDRRRAAVNQPLAVVMGMRAIGPAAKMRRGRFLHLRTWEPEAALQQLFDHEVRHVLVEGGATIAAAFLRTGLVDRIVWFVAPKLLGAGAPAIADLGIATITDALQWQVQATSQVGPDIRIDLNRVTTEGAS